MDSAIHLSNNWGQFITFFTFRFVTVKSTYSIIIFFVTIPQDPTCYTYIKMISFETLWDPGYANRISNLNGNNITNSQWRAIQLAWLAHWVKHCVRSSKRSGTFSTTRIISTSISLSAVHNMSHFIYFHSRHSPHREYYDLTMACFPVSFISLMDKALRPVFANVRVRFQVKPKIFSGSYSTAYWGCLFNWEDHFMEFQTVRDI